MTRGEIPSAVEVPLDQLLRLIDHIACVVDASGRVLGRHPRWSDRAPGSRLTEWFRQTDRDAVARAIATAAGDAGRGSVQAHLVDGGTALALDLSRVAPDCLLVAATPAGAENTPAEAQLRAVLEHTPAMIYLKDLKGRFRYINPDFAQHYGISPEWLSGRTVYDLFPPREAAEFAERDERTIATRETVRQQIRVPEPGPSGGERVFDALKFPITDGQDGVTMLAGIELDVTERERVSEALARSEARYRRLYERAPMMLHSIDREGRLIGVSGYWLSHLGYDEDDVIGRLSADFLTEESRRYARERILPEFFRTGQCISVPYQVVCADGSIIDVVLSAVAEYDDTGAIDHSLAVMTDVTQQRRVEAAYREIFKKTSDGMFRAAPDGQLLQANPALARMHGFDSVEELFARIGPHGADWYTDSRARDEIVSRLESDGRVEAFEAEIRPINRPGRIWTSESLQATHDPAGRLLYYEGSSREITSEYKARRLTQHRNRLLELIAHNRPINDILEEVVAIAEADTEMTVAVFVQQGFRLDGAATASLPPAVAEALHGRGVDELGGIFRDALRHNREYPAWPLGGDGEPGAATASAAAEGYGAVTIVPVHNQKGEALGLLLGLAETPAALDDDCNDLLRELGQLASIAIEQQRLAADLVHQAQYDGLTDLPNRGLLRDRLEQAIRDAERGGYQVGVLMLDLDEFKRVNDSLGHSWGDKLLQRVAERLSGCLRAGDTVARLGGDEFVVVVPLRHGGDYCNVLADRILTRLADSVTLADRAIAPHSSVGISIYPDDGHEPEALLKAADTAMYAAKHAGRNRYHYFAEHMNRHISERLRIESELHDALSRDDLALYFQPRVALVDGHIVGAEGLLRWHHPRDGLVLPGHFIPVAERSPLIGEIDRLVLALVLHRLASRKTEAHGMVFSINLSSGELHDEEFAARVAHAVDVAGVDPGALEIEITERMLMHDFERASVQLGELKARAPGLRIAIDDFGSGYSSLNYLRQLPVDTLKIDRSFVSGIDGDDRRAGPIAKTIVELAHNLDLNVVAEGIETAAQRQALMDYGCSEGQGFLFDAALPFDDLLDRLGSAAPETRIEQ